MKTERRHELETNELADSLGHWIDRVQPYLRTIVGLLIAVVVLIFAYTYIDRQSAAKAREGWEEYFQALNDLDRHPEAFDDVADKYPRTPVGWWATTTLGDLELINGTNLLFSNKVDANDQLKKATKHYRSVIGEAKEAAVLAHATFGFAQAEEALGELDKAREAYLRIGANWPGSSFEQSAEARAKDLDRNATKEFYDWFERQDPAKAMAREPGVPGLKMPFDINALESPAGSSATGLPTDFLPGMPSLGSGESGAEQAPADDEPSETVPSESAPDKDGTSETDGDVQPSNEQAPSDQSAPEQPPAAGGPASPAGGNASPAGKSAPGDKKSARP